MKREIVFLTALLLCLTACSKNTTVYIPEEAVQVQSGTVVHIPVKPTEETESRPTEASEPVTPTETEPGQTNSSTISKTPGSSSNQGGSGDPEDADHKETMTGSKPTPEETKPPASEPGHGQTQITATMPGETEPVSTEPTGTELPATEPPTTEPPFYDISGYVVGDLEYAILSRINEYRVEEGLGELPLDAYLCAIASCRSFEVSQVWSHTRPDGRGYETVLDDYGYGGSPAGELLGYSTGDAAAVVDKWMNSESHRAVLLGCSSAAGIGIYYAGGVIYVTCLLIG